MMRRDRGYSWRPLQVALLMAGGLLATVPGNAQTRLPEGFVRVADVAPTIRQDMRYAGAVNFTGRVVPGYRGNVCIVARPVGRALARVQESLAPQGLSLVMLDCYRPVRATRAFMAWAGQPATPAERRRWHPRIDRRDVVRLGYVSRASSHSRGVAVDLTLTRIASNQPTASPRPTGVLAPPEARANIETCRTSGVEQSLAGALEMGSGYDCFDTISHTADRSISAEARANRRLLLAAMQAEGFVNYRREWWHFTLDAPGFERSYDFPVD